MLVRIAIYFIKFYKVIISPLSPLPKCRFIPTCSEYGLQAMEKYGFFKGGYLLCIRILKCNPCGPHGYDPLK